MDSRNVERTLEILLEDYERQDQRLDRVQVEQLLARRELDPDEAAAVFSHLFELKITLSESESDNPGSLAEILSTLDREKSRKAESGQAPHLVEAAIKRSKLLSAEEEVELGAIMELGRQAAGRLQEGAPPTPYLHEAVARGGAARERMILSNLRLVLSESKYFQGCGNLQFEDLFQEGVLGLIRAVDKFDHRLGNKFSTYAVWWVRQGIMTALAERGIGAVRLPAKVQLEVIQLNRAVRFLTGLSHGKRPSDEQLAYELGWPVNRIQVVQRIAMIQTVFLGDLTASGDSALSIGDLLPADQMDPFEEAEQREYRIGIRRALHCLDPRSRRILVLRFDLANRGQELTLEEIGQQEGVTRERIRQVEEKALGRLRTRGFRASREAK